MATTTNPSSVNHPESPFEHLGWIDGIAQAVIQNDGIEPFGRLPVVQSATSNRVGDRSQPGPLDTLGRPIHTHVLAETEAGQKLQEPAVSATDIEDLCFFAP